MTDKEDKTKLFGSASDGRILQIWDLPKIVCETGPSGPYLWLGPPGNMQMFAQVRGWGWMQYHKSGEDLQDRVGRELTRRWNECPKIEAALEAANEHIHSQGSVVSKKYRAFENEIHELRMRIKHLLTQD